MQPCLWLAFGHLLGASRFGCVPCLRCVAGHLRRRATRFAAHGSLTNGPGQASRKQQSWWLPKVSFKVNPKRSRCTTFTVHRGAPASLSPLVGVSGKSDRDGCGVEDAGTADISREGGDGGVVPIPAGELLQHVSSNEAGRQPPGLQEPEATARSHDGPPQAAASQPASGSSAVDKRAPACIWFAAPVTLTGFRPHHKEETGRLGDAA